MATAFQPNAFQNTPTHGVAGFQVEGATAAVIQAASGIYIPSGIDPEANYRRWRQERDDMVREIHRPRVIKPQVPIHPIYRRRLP